MFSLERHTILLTLAGSHAHGTAREGSDVDLRGICIAPLPERLSLFQTFEQFEGPLNGELTSAALPRLESHPTASRARGEKLECVVFDIAKFVTFDELLAITTQLEENLHRATLQTALPDDVDRERVDRLATELMLMSSP